MIHDVGAERDIARARDAYRGQRIQNLMVGAMEAIYSRSKLKDSLSYTTLEEILATQSVRRYIQGLGLNELDNTIEDCVLRVMGLEQQAN